MKAKPKTQSQALATSEGRKPTVFELEDELAKTFEEYSEIVDQFGEDNEAAKMLEEVVETYATAVAEKRERLAGYLRHLKYQQDLAAMEIKRLQQYKKAKENAERRLRAMLVGIMDWLGLDKLRGQTSSLYIRDNAASLIIEDERKIPAKYRVPLDPKPLPYKLDKGAIRADLQAGKKVKGAYLADPTRTIQVR